MIESLRSKPYDYLRIVVSLLPDELPADTSLEDMPNDELLVALDQLMQASITQEQSMSSDNAAVYEFLHTVKLAMRTSKDECQAKPL